MHEVANLKIIPGDPLSPFILHVPHSSRYLPEEVRQDILLSDKALERELDEMTDSHTEVLAEQAAKKSLLRPWIFLNTFSRLVIDPERFPDEREEMNSIGMGAVYQTTSGGVPLRANDSGKEKTLLDKYFFPYAQIFEDFTRSRLRAMGQIAIVDVHSYRVKAHMNSLNKGLRRPPICIGTDPFHTPAWLQNRALAAFGALGEIAMNE
ncbi:MAG: N-formylglutamate amidohydrolase, partial [Actinobacteria bacterium]|nr:N-formylglutamate amidohydrolase [Actinomycetota bacterium]